VHCIYRHMPNVYQLVERRNYENFDRLDLGAKTIGPFSALRHRLIVLIQEATMRQYTTYEFDNRDSAQVYQYMEARIEALKRRIEQLEAEKKARSSDLHCAQTKSSAA
jgi:hypothetical protein